MTIPLTQLITTKIGQQKLEIVPLKSETVRENESCSLACIRLVKMAGSPPGQALFFCGTSEGIHVGPLDVGGGLDIVWVRNQVR